jgi:anhydro-N-acetylmuramic acid kinase
MSDETTQKLHIAGTLYGNVVEQLGKAVFNQLGIKVKQDALAIHGDRMITSLGMAAVESLIASGMLVKTQIPTKDIYTLQSGDPNTLTVETNIITIADFRGIDIALGGQGAPLAPAFHQSVFSSSTTNRAIINIGGIANVTYLPSNPAEKIMGFDTGPGNTLSDYWVDLHKNVAYDDAGQWAKNGQIIDGLLAEMVNKESFFTQPAPKSTGTDHFNASWLSAFNINDYTPNDVQTTLVELTALSIANSILGLPNTQIECYICGGGSQNLYLIERIQKRLPTLLIQTTKPLGIDPDYVEAIAFAWLAKQRIDLKPGNISSSTHANHPAILGGIYSSNH